MRSRVALSRVLLAVVVALAVIVVPDFDRVYGEGGSWATKAPMPTGRRGLAAGVVNGILYAVGGNGSSGILNTVEAYDPSTDTWTPKASMPTGLCLPQGW